MAKKKGQPKFQIDVMLDDDHVVTLNDVMIKEVDPPKDGGQWFQLNKRGNNYQVLTTPNYLLDLTITEPQVIEFDRESNPASLVGGGERHAIGILTSLNLKDHCFYAIDQTSDGTRIQYTPSILEGYDHSQIKQFKVSQQ